MKTKQIPITVVLMGAAAACVISILQQVEFSVFFKRLLITVIVFSIIGTFAKIALDAVFNKKAEEEDSQTAETDEAQEDIKEQENDSIEDDGIRGATEGSDNEDQEDVS